MSDEKSGSGVGQAAEPVGDVGASSVLESESPMADQAGWATGGRNVWKRQLRWVLLVIFLTPVGWLSGVAVMNYTGYCFKQSRYLTDEERIRTTVEGILWKYPRTTYAYDILPTPGYEVVDDKSRCCGQGDMSRFDKSRGGAAIDAEQLILYRDIDEFFAINPDCCSFSRNGLYGEIGHTELWDKITGYSAGFTNVKFRVRYRDAEGRVQTKFSAVSYNETNCGRGFWPLFGQSNQLWRWTFLHLMSQRAACRA
jgi:hypothetical protein